EEEYAGMEHDIDLSEQQVTPSKAPQKHPNKGQKGKLARKIQEEEQTKALEQQEQERANFEAALKLQKQLDQERKEADDIEWQKIVEQVQERQYEL
ncbi:hypothetical protein Tco_0263131, partial [Tanacetum coccineum]